MAKKANTIDYVEFPAESVPGLAEAKRFYGAVFGWSFTDWGDDYIDTTDSGLGSGFNADPGQRTGKPLVVVYVADLRRACAQVVAAGGRITRELFSFPGGQRFHFVDPLGNELAAWSDQGEAT